MILRLFSLSTCLLLANDARCDSLRPPFVAGFERFVRTGDASAAIGGRLLLSELNCAACHSSKRKQSNDAPRLDGAGNRLQREWLQKFLANPSQTKPGTTMPNVLHGLPDKEKDHTIRALVAFLSVQRASFPKLKSDARNPIAHEFWLKGNAQRGRKLYHQIGCVACHEPDDKYEVMPRIPSPFEKLLSQLTPEERKKLKMPLPPRPVKSVPHGDLTAKYTRRSLTFFLLKPETARPNGRMPNFQLQPNQAADVAEYLLRTQPTDIKSIEANQDDMLAKEGRKLFQKLRCADCHFVAGMKPLAHGKPFAKLKLKTGHSCLQKPRVDSPLFNLDDTQRNALQLAITDHRNLEKNPESANEHIAFRMLQLNCYGCHRRDKRGGVAPKRQAYFETVGHVDIGDEGRLPPSLDDVGGKITTGWLKKVFGGTGHVRPFMTARMPKFPAAMVAPLPKWFADADKMKDAAKTPFGDTGKIAKTGRTLFNNAGCLQCHSLGGEKLPGVVGVDIANVGNRLHAQWFRDFLLDPAKLKPGTRMPTFFPKGKSQFPKILGGDVDQQIGAMWAYLNDVARQSLPEKLLLAKLKNFELVPKKRPVLLRTFMDEAGPMAIAVGFPEKVHLAFDAQDVHVALAWRGRFLDAHGTWFNRLAPPAKPLGQDVIRMPYGVPFLIRDKKQPDYQFRGYRLDASGVPTFLYRFGPFDVEDRFEPAPNQTLKRCLRVVRRDPKSTAKSNLSFRANAGGTLQRHGQSNCKNDLGLITTVLRPNGNSGEIRKREKNLEWHIPIEIGREAIIEVLYQW